MENRLALATAAGQDWLTVVAAAQVLGVSESSAYALVNNGTLKARKHGSKLRVDPASVAYVLDARRATGPRAIRAEGVPSECADLIQSVNRIHMLRVQVEVELRALEADGRAAEAQDELDRATTCYELVQQLRGAVYQWNAGRGTWSVALPNGLERESASPDGVGV